MKLVQLLILTSLVCATRTIPVSAAKSGVEPVRLLDPINLGDRTLGPKETAMIVLPGLPAKAGKVVVLQLRMVSYTSRAAGCNFNAELRINNEPLGRHTVAGEERLIGRPPMFEFARGDAGRQFQVISGPMVMTMFAPDVETGDGMTRDGRGASFLLNISDLVRGVDGNTLAIRNVRKGSTPGARLDLLVRAIQVGWLDKKDLPVRASRVPRRDNIADSVSLGSLRLSQAKAGGFVVTADDGSRLLVETGISMTHETPSDLMVANEEPADRSCQLLASRQGPAGYRLVATWPRVSLTRTIELTKQGVLWKERWTNTGKHTLGIPFRHRCFLHEGPGRFWLGGDADVGALAGSAMNPTLFVGSRLHQGNGFGITAQSDWLRLLMRLRAESGVGEIYTQELALAPGSSIDFALTISSVTDGGGYWSFINEVRERWAVNGYCQERPIFWGYARAGGATGAAKDNSQSRIAAAKGGQAPSRAGSTKGAGGSGGSEPVPVSLTSKAEEQIRRSLGHLGPIIVTHGPWVRLGYDVGMLRRGRWPKLADGSAPTPGKTPDLDIDAYLAFDHREPFWQQYAKDVAQMHRACPGIQVMQLMHPAMEVAYKPLAHRWPYAQDTILTAAGIPFAKAPTHSRAHLGDLVAKDWGVLYYVPRPGFRLSWCIAARCAP